MSNRLSFVTLAVYVIVAIVTFLATPCQGFSRVNLSDVSAVRPIEMPKRKYSKNAARPLGQYHGFTALHATTTKITTTTTPTTTPTPTPTKIAPQVLEFQEPTTGVTVKLVGCMHYNPASIQLTTDTISELARNNQLGSVVIESCDIRWDQNQHLPRSIQNLLQSEMKAACELSLYEYQRPVVLGDQRINITVASLKQGFQETLIDLATPWNGGWNRLLGNITMAQKEAFPLKGDAYLNLFAFLDPKLLFAAPVSLVKYPLSYFFKAPLPTTAFLALLFFIDQPADAATIVTIDQMTLVDWLGSLALSGIEIALFARVFLKELLAERNKLLARNILEQCKLYQTSSPRQSEARRPNFWNGLVARQAEPQRNNAMEIIYVDGFNNPPPSVIADSRKRTGSNEKAIVAVLGMAHCNGIMKLLKEQKV